MGDTAVVTTASPSSSSSSGASLGVLFLGPKGAGKTSLYRHYNQKPFDPDLRPTLTTEQCIRRGELIHGKRRDVTLKDVCGQDTYAQNLTKWHLRGMHAAVYVADCTRYAEAIQRASAAGVSRTFTADPLRDDVFGLARWAKVVNAIEPDIGRIVVFNKIDLLTEVARGGATAANAAGGKDGWIADFPDSLVAGPTTFLKKDDIERHLQEMGLTAASGGPITYFFTSMKTGQGADAVIQAAFDAAVERLKDMPQATPSRMIVDRQKWSPEQPKPPSSCPC